MTDETKRCTFQPCPLYRFSRCVPADIEMCQCYDMKGWNMTKRATKKALALLKSDAPTIDEIIHALDLEELENTKIKEI